MAGAWIDDILARLDGPCSSSGAAPPDGRSLSRDLSLACPKHGADQTIVTGSGTNSAAGIAVGKGNERVRFNEASLNFRGFPRITNATAPVKAEAAANFSSSDGASKPALECRGQSVAAAGGEYAPRLKPIPSDWRSH